MTSASQKDLREHLKSPLTWHWIGFGIMTLLVVILAIRLVMDWNVTHGNAANAASGKQAQYHALEQGTVPMRGLDKRVEDVRAQVSDFYAKRIPANYSTIATHVGNVQVQSGVHMTRLQYTQKKPNGALTEISLDASISGSYAQIMKFINGLERDQTFFVVRNAALTGQQTGQVNLRLSVSTWLRTADAEAAAKEIPADNAGQATSTTNAPGKEGI